MAIVKMKKLRAISMRSQRDALLRELQKLGCVELTAQDYTPDESEAAAVLTPDAGPVMEAQAERQSFRKAIDVLDQYAPVKTPLLSPKPELSAEALLDAEEAEAMRKTAAELDALSERLKAIASEASKEKLRAEALSPWKSCPLPLDCAGTKSAAVVFGALPRQAGMDALSADLAEQAAAELYPVSEDESARYVYVIYFRDDGETVLRALREHGFTAPAFGETAGFASDGIAQAEKRLRELEAERTEIEETIAAAADKRDGLRRGYDRAEANVQQAEAVGKLMRMQSTVFFSGWVPAAREADVTAVLDRFDCAYEYDEPAEEEYGDVPVELKNNKLTDGLNMVTNMYSLPRYGTLDPNPLMAPFFIVFYGIMMADMGYGLLMFIIGLLIMTKKKPKAGFMRYFGELMMEGGVTTFIFGVLTAGFFGDAAKQLALMFNPESTFTWFWPALFDPLNDTIYVLAGAMVLGFIQLNAGMVVSFVQKVKRGEILDGILYEVAEWIIFIGAALLYFVHTPIVLIIGVVMLFAGAMRGKKGFAIFTSIFSTLYNELTGWFGDILSYSRLMALMLAGSVIAQVFNTLGALPRNIIVFIIIFLLGHALNFGLNLLGCYVHDLRLQCLEYFGKFYVDGGRPFQPLRMNTKYVDVVNK